MTVDTGNQPGDDAVANEVLARVELSVAHILRRADRAARRSDSRPPALERSAYLVLVLLQREGPTNVNAIADHLSLDASTVTRQVTAMENVGHVRRRRDDQDRRAVAVEPTDAGLAALAAHRDERETLYAQILAGWSRLDRALLAELLERLDQDIDAFRRG